MNNKLRLFLLTLLAVFVSGVSQAQDIYTISFNGSNAQSTEGYFTWNSDKHNFNSKFTGAEYAGITFTSGLKMESATYVNFTSTAASTVTIVQSTWSDKTLKFDGNELAISSAESGTGYRVYTLTDVESGAHSVTRGSGESGIFYISVEYTGATLEVLSTPVISFDSATGEVTIEGDANATSIVYTIDGTDPSATNGEVYEGVFTVEDGTTVKAIALGDGETYTNSDIATVRVLLDVASVAAPTFTVAYGTVAIACETANVTIEYSTDGENFTEYVVPVTLFEDGTVYARAIREGIESEVASVEVEAVSKGEATNSIVMYFDAFDVQTVNGYSTLVGKEGTDTEGYSISLNNSSKSWSSANSINGYKSIKVSNGAQNTLYLPEGVSATRITLYSYINSAPGRDTGWKEISDLNTQYKDVLMQAWQNAANPDVRTYPLTGEETEINFTNTGEQVCFYIVLDVLNSGEVEPVEYEEILTYSMDNENYAAKEDLEAGLGKIYFGADKRETVEDEAKSSCGYGYKCDGDADSKYALLMPSRPLQVGDVINIKAFATSNGGGLSLFPTRDGEALVTLNLSAKNTEEELSYTVKKGDGLAGLSSIYVYRLFGKSTYITEVHIIGAKAKEDADYVTASISYAGYATLYYGDKALIVPEGVKAFTVTVEDVNIIEGTVYEAGATIPAGEAVVLQGAAGSYKFVVDAESTAAPTTDNMLKGTDEAAETTGGDKYYKLTVKKVNGEDLVGFYYGANDGAAFVNGAHRAYLAVTGAAAKYYVFNGEATGINSIEKAVAADGAIYNLQGVRVDAQNMVKGIYVVNGKKVVIK